MSRELTTGENCLLDTGAKNSNIDQFYSTIDVGTSKRCKWFRHHDRIFFWSCKKNVHVFLQVTGIIYSQVVLLEPWFFLMNNVIENYPSAST